VELKIDNNSIEKLVQEQLKVQVAAILSQKSDYLVQKLVEQALNAKPPNSYRDVTILDESIQKMIRDEAASAVGEWLDSKRADIRKQVHAALAKKSSGLVAKIVEQLVVGLGSELHVQAWLKNKD
jgi:hypothetical protein